MDIKGLLFLLVQQ